MNTKRLRHIAKVIQQHPTQFSMREWFSDYLDDKETHAGGCGTAACIAGWARHIYGWKSKKKKTLKETTRKNTKCAMELLDITENQKEMLFFANIWPEPFRTQYALASIQDKAKIAAARIEHFIQTEGRE